MALPTGMTIEQYRQREALRESILASKLVKAGGTFSATDASRHLSDHRKGIVFKRDNARTLLDAMVKEGLLGVAKTNGRVRYTAKIEKADDEFDIMGKWVTTDNGFRLGVALPWIS